MKNSISILQNFILIMIFVCTSNVISSKPKPKLAVVIVVDQMRYDYLIRYSGYFNSGLAELINNGAYFTQAYHDHAYTSTAPGHATIATGCYPSKHGIVLNDYYDHSENKVVYSCSDSTSKILNHPEMKGISPKRLLRNGISDWIKKSDKRSKVFCVSIKDRPSVMLGGKKPDGIFWYDDNSGSMVTSEYYMNSYPAWTDSFNSSEIVYKHFNDNWVKLLDEDSYYVSREDDFPYENDRVGRVFPHHLKKYIDDRKSFLKLLPFSPYGDEYIFTFAKTIIENENLGNDEIPDLLFIGNSTGDKLGHDFGPLSQEMEDYYLWLDKYIGEFITYLDQKIGKENFVIALSADHGTATISEELQRRGYDSKRISSSDVKEAYFKAYDKVRLRFGLSNSIIRSSSSSGMVLNYEESDINNIPRNEIRKSLAKELANIDFVADTYTIDELNSGVEKEYIDNYRKNYLPGRGYDIMIRYKKYYTLSHDNDGVSHGTPYDYDSHVPVIFYGSGIKPGKINDRISTVDIAPTLAEILGIKYDKDIDGISLINVIQN